MLHGVQISGMRIGLQGDFRWTQDGIHVRYRHLGLASVPSFTRKIIPSPKDSNSKVSTKLLAKS
jgi:hypothetical protein